MTQPTVNVEQSDAWNGEEGVQWVEERDRYDAMMSQLTPHLIDAAKVAPTDLLLDVGCGNGLTTRTAARLARQGSALGVDLSAPMLDCARQIAEAEGLANVRFVQGDAQVYAFDASTFDLAMSRFGIMFFADPKAAFTNIGGAIRAGGRLAFLCWQDAFANEWIAVPAAAALAHVPMPELGGGGPGPFSLADRDHITALLRSADFRNVEISAVSEPMLLGRDPDDVVDFMAHTGMGRGLLGSVDDTTAARALNAMREALAAYQTPDGVRLASAAWLVTATC